jgi:hypothetical protein
MFKYKFKCELHIGYYYLLIKIKLIKLTLVKILINLGFVVFPFSYVAIDIPSLGFISDPIDKTRLKY